VVRAVGSVISGQVFVTGKFLFLARKIASLTRNFISVERKGVSLGRNLVTLGREMIFQAGRASPLGPPASRRLLS
jgi:hypothetical protein